MSYPNSTPRGVLFWRKDPPASPEEAARRGWGTQDIYCHFDISEATARQVVWLAEKERLARKK